MQSPARMKKIHCLVVSVAFIAAVTVVRATTVIAPSFDQLVQQAQVIFQGSVSNVQSMWVGEGADRHIESDITFQVEDSVKGTAGQSYTVHMFGGTIGTEGMSIS